MRFLELEPAKDGVRVGGEGRLLLDGKRRLLRVFLYFAALQLFGAAKLSLCSRSFTLLMYLFSLSEQLNFPFSSFHDLHGWCSIAWFVSSFSVQWVELAAMAKFDVKRGVKFKVHPFSKLPGLFFEVAIDEIRFLTPPCQSR